MIEIPLTNYPKQEFSIRIADETYTIFVLLNARLGEWSMSIALNNSTIVDGIQLLSGADVLKQYRLPFKNAYIINLENPNQDATKDNLGTVARLFILTDEEIEDAETV